MFATMRYIASQLTKNGVASPWASWVDIIINPVLVVQFLHHGHTFTATCILVFTVLPIYNQQK